MTTPSKPENERLLSLADSIESGAANFYQIHHLIGDQPSQVPQALVVAALRAFGAAAQSKHEAVAPFPPPPHGWTCFHCGETFHTVASASEHFGSAVADKPGCVLKSERGLLEHIRETELKRDELEVRLTMARVGGDKVMEDEAVERFYACRSDWMHRPLSFPPHDRVSQWKPGDLRCDTCDNGIDKSWVACPYCGSPQSQEVKAEELADQLAETVFFKPLSEMDDSHDEYGPSWTKDDLREAATTILAKYDVRAKR
jgi:hypothetical protein